MELYLEKMLIRQKSQLPSVLGSPRFNNLEGLAALTHVSLNYWELEDGLVISSLVLRIYRASLRRESIWKSERSTRMYKMATRSYLTLFWL